MTISDELRLLAQRLDAGELGPFDAGVICLNSDEKGYTAGLGFIHGDRVGVATLLTHCVEALADAPERTLEAGPIQ